MSISQFDHFRFQNGPFYAYLFQTNKGNGAGDWHRYLVSAATRHDMKIFFRGLQKYSKTSNPKITEVEPVHLAWWNFKSPEGFNVLYLIRQMDRENPSWYNSVDELTQSSGKIMITLLNDSGGRDWPIIPAQNVSLEDFHS